jgi:glycosyltransferase involved in cell wall biosynthesis
MTIVHIGPPHLPILYSRGGATERRIRELAKRQAQTGSRVIVYSAEETARALQYGGFEIRAMACRRRGIARTAEFLFKSLHDARSVKPDILHFHALPEGASFANLFRLKAKTMLSYDFFEFRRGKKNPFFPWYRTALMRFSSLLPVSRYCHRESASYWSIPQMRMKVIYNGVSVQQFHPDPAAAAFRHSALGLNREFVVLYVGRVCRQKGTDLLLEACARLREDRRNVRLLIAGPLGQFGQELDNGFAKLLHHPGVTYLGPVDENMLASIYNVSDVFVMPTRAYEMFGMAAIEAQACGKPVICSNHGGLPEVITSSSGLLFRAGDSADLAQQLRFLMDDTPMRRRLSEGAEKNAHRFAWETITSELSQVYHGVQPAQ